MAKFGIGVGEEFPAGEPSPEPPPPDRPHRRGGWHIALHIALRLAVIALVIGAAVWLFQGFGSPYPGQYRYGFFPLFSLLAIVLLIFALRRGHYCGHGWRMRYRLDEMRYWHDQMHRERGEFL
jgi:hypothetical protein